VNPAHRDHDELLIVRAASGDADAVDARLAERQLAACVDCRTLLADIHAVRSSTVANVLRVPPRPRSFRISPDELERLRAPAWRRWLGRFGKPRFDLVRPLATAVAGLGLAVLVLGSAVPAASPAALVQATPEVPGERGATGAPTVTDSESQMNGAYASPAEDSAGRLGPKSTATPAEAPPAVGLERARDLADEQTPLPIAPIGVVILGSGLALVVLNTAARRAAGR